MPAPIATLGATDKLLNNEYGLNPRDDNSALFEQQGYGIGVNHAGWWLDYMLDPNKPYLNDEELQDYFDNKADGPHDGPYWRSSGNVKYGKYFRGIKDEDKEKIHKARGGTKVDTGDVDDNGNPVYEWVYDPTKATDTDFALYTQVLTSMTYDLIPDESAGGRYVTNNLGQREFKWNKMRTAYVLEGADKYVKELIDIQSGDAWQGIGAQFSHTVEHLSDAVVTSSMNLWENLTNQKVLDTSLIIDEYQDAAKAGGHPLPEDIGDVMEGIQKGYYGHSNTKFLDHHNKTYISPQGVKKKGKSTFSESSVARQEKLKTDAISYLNANPDVAAHLAFVGENLYGGGVGWEGFTRATGKLLADTSPSVIMMMGANVVGQAAGATIGYAIGFIPGAVGGFTGGAATPIPVVDEVGGAFAGGHAGGMTGANIGRNIGGVLTSFLSGFMLEQGSMENEAYEYFRQQGYSPQTAKAMAAQNTWVAGLLAGGLEAVPFVRYMNKWGGDDFAKGLKRSIINGQNKSINKLKNGEIPKTKFYDIKQKWKNVSLFMNEKEVWDKSLYIIPTQMIAEGVTEFLQENVNSFNRSVYSNGDFAYEAFSPESRYAFVSGVFAGGTMSAAGQTLSAGWRKVRPTSNKEVDADFYKKLDTLPLEKQAEILAQVIEIDIAKMKANPKFTEDVINDYRKKATENAELWIKIQKEKSSLGFFDKLKMFFNFTGQENINQTTVPDTTTSNGPEQTADTISVEDVLNQLINPRDKDLRQKVAILDSDTTEDKDVEPGSALDLRRKLKKAKGDRALGYITIFTDLFNSDNSLELSDKDGFQDIKLKVLDAIIKRGVDKDKADEVFNSMWRYITKKSPSLSSEQAIEKLGSVLSGKEIIVTKKEDPTNQAFQDAADTITFEGIDYQAEEQPEITGDIEEDADSTITPDITEEQEQANIEDSIDETGVLPEEQIDEMTDETDVEVDIDDVDTGGAIVGEVDEDGDTVITPTPSTTTVPETTETTDTTEETTEEATEEVTEVEDTPAEKKKTIQKAKDAVPDILNHLKNYTKNKTGKFKKKAKDLMIAGMRKYAGKMGGTRFFGTERTETLFQRWLGAVLRDQRITGTKLFQLAESLDVDVSDLRKHAKDNRLGLDNASYRSQIEERIFNKYQGEVDARIKEAMGDAKLSTSKPLSFYKKTNLIKEKKSDLKALAIEEGILSEEEASGMNKGELITAINDQYKPEQKIREKIANKRKAKNKKRKEQQEEKLKKLEEEKSNSNENAETLEEEETVEEGLEEEKDKDRSFKETLEEELEKSKAPNTILETLKKLKKRGKNQKVGLAIRDISKYEEFAPDSVRDADGNIDPELLEAWIDENQKGFMNSFDDIVETSKELATLFEAIWDTMKVTMNVSFEYFAKTTHNYMSRKYGELAAAVFKQWAINYNTTMKGWSESRWKPFRQVGGNFFERIQKREIEDFTRQTFNTIVDIRGMNEDEQLANEEEGNVGHDETDILFNQSDIGMIATSVMEYINLVRLATNRMPLTPEEIGEIVNLALLNETFESFFTNFGEMDFLDINKIKTDEVRIFRRLYQKVHSQSLFSRKADGSGGASKMIPLQIIYTNLVLNEDGIFERTESETGKGYGPSNIIVKHNTNIPVDPKTNSKLPSYKVQTFLDQDGRVGKTIELNNSDVFLVWKTEQKEDKTTPGKTQTVFSTFDANQRIKPDNMVGMGMFLMSGAAINGIGYYAKALTRGGNGARIIYVEVRKEHFEAAGYEVKENKNGTIDVVTNDNVSELKAAFRRYLHKEHEAGRITEQQGIDIMAEFNFENNIVKEGDEETNTEAKFPYYAAQWIARHEYLKNAFHNHYLAKDKKTPNMSNADATNRIRIPMAEGTTVRGLGETKIAVLGLDDLTLEIDGNPVELSEDYTKSGEKRYRYDGLIGTSTNTLKRTSELLGTEDDAYDVKSFFDYRSADGEVYIGVKGMEFQLDEGMVWFKKGKEIARTILNANNEVQIQFKAGNNRWVDVDFIVTNEEVKVQWGLDKDSVLTLGENNRKVQHLQQGKSKTTANYPFTWLDSILPLIEQDSNIQKDYDIIKEYLVKSAQIYTDRYFDLINNPQELLNLLDSKELKKLLQGDPIQKIIDMIKKHNLPADILLHPFFARDVEKSIQGKLLRDMAIKGAVPGRGTVAYTKPNYDASLKSEKEVSVSVGNTTIQDYILNIIKSQANTEEQQRFYEEIIRHKNTNPKSLKHIDLINQWLNDNTVELLFFRQPLVDSQALDYKRIVKIDKKSLGDNIAFHPTDVFGRQQGDHDGDKTYVSMLPQQVLDAHKRIIDSKTFQDNKGAIRLELHKSEPQNNNLHSLHDNLMFTLRQYKSAGAIGQLTNVKNSYFQAYYKNMEFTVLTSAGQSTTRVIVPINPNQKIVDNNGLKHDDLIYFDNGTLDVTNEAVLNMEFNDGEAVYYYETVDNQRMIRIVKTSDEFKGLVKQGFTDFHMVMNAKRFLSIVSQGSVDNAKLQHLVTWGYTGMRWGLSFLFKDKQGGKISMSGKSDKFALTQIKKFFTRLMNYNSVANDRNQWKRSHKPSEFLDAISSFGEGILSDNENQIQDVLDSAGPRDAQIERLYTNGKYTAREEIFRYINKKIDYLRNEQLRTTPLSLSQNKQKNINRLVRQWIQDPKNNIFNKVLEEMVLEKKVEITNTDIENVKDIATLMLSKYLSIFAKIEEGKTIVDIEQHSNTFIYNQEVLDFMNEMLPYWNGEKSFSDYGLADVKLEGALGDAMRTLITLEQQILTRVVKSKVRNNQIHKEVIHVRDRQTFLPFELMDERGLIEYVKLWTKALNDKATHETEIVIPETKDVSFWDRVDDKLMKKLGCR